MANLTHSQHTLRLLICILSSLTLLSSCNNVGHNSTDSIDMTSTNVSILNSGTNEENSNAKTALNNELTNELNLKDDSYDTNAYLSKSVPQKSDYTYITSGNKIKIYKIEDNGSLTDTHLDITTPNGSGIISAIAIAPNNRFVYATINTPSGDKIYILNLHSNGSLTTSSTPTIPTNTGANSIAISKDGKFAYVSSSTQICSYTIESTSGALLYNNDSCKEYGYSPYSQITLSASGKYAFALGGKNSESILTFSRNTSTGVLGYLSKYSFSNNSPISNRSMVIPNAGHYIYTALKGNNAVGEYTIESATGKVSSLYAQTSISAELAPHSMAITPNSKYVYATNYDSNTISMYSRNSNGTLNHLSPTSITTGSKPDKIAIDPSGQFVYVSTVTDKKILQYHIIEGSGILETIAGTMPIMLSESISQILTTRTTHPRISIDSVNVINGTLKISLSDGGELTSDGLKVQQNVSQANSMGEVHTEFTGTEELLIISIVAISVRQFLVTLEGMLPNHIVAAKGNGLKDPYGTPYTNVAHHGTGATTTQMINPEPNSTKVDTSIQIIINSYDPIDKNSFHLVDLMSEIEIVGATTTGAQESNFWLKFKPDEPLAINTNYEVYMMRNGAKVQSWRFTTTNKDTIRLMKIYTATNKNLLRTTDRGYRANLGSIEEYDKRCNRDRNKPKETDGGPPPIYRALMGTNMRQPGEPEWPLEPNTYYYNTDLYSIIGITNERSELYGFIEGTDADIEYTITLNNPILPYTKLQVLTGIDTIDSPDTPWKISDDTCENWTTQSARVMIGMNPPNNGFYLNEVFSDATAGCGDERRAIYCAQVQ